MNRTLCLCLLGLSATALAGCSAPLASSQPVTGPGVEPMVALGDLGVADESARRTMYFGAGDALGQEVFTFYVASLRTTEEFYATGANDFPSND